MICFDQRPENSRSIMASEVTDPAAVRRMRGVITASVTTCVICILMICVIALFAAGTVFADDYNGADAHSPSMTAGSGEEPIADESTTKDYVSTDGAAAGDSAAETQATETQADEADNGAGDQITGDNDASDEGSGKTSSVLKGLKNIISGIPLIVLFAFAVLAAALIIVLLTLKKTRRKCRKRDAYRPRH